MCRPPVCVPLDRRVVRLVMVSFVLVRDLQSATVTRKKAAGMELASLRELWFWRLNTSSSSFCKSAARAFFSAGSKSFIVGALHFGDAAPTDPGGLSELKLKH